MIITIDTGTTNTRVALFDGARRIDAIKSGVGVRDTGIDGNNQRLVATIAASVSTLKERHGLCDNDISAILAAGMITSNLGLVEVPHLVAPVSPQDFANGIHSQVIEEISALPIHFVPGVKNIDYQPGDNLAEQDIMRGEEVEALAIAEACQIDQAAIIALPGSHSKFVALDNKRSILGCCTTLAGELIDIITRHTILTSSLQGQFTDELCYASLLAGYREAERTGLGKALFSIRLLEQFGQKPQNELASYLVGVVLHSDLKAIATLQAQSLSAQAPVYVGGRGILCDATAYLLTQTLNDIAVIQCSDLDDLSAAGAMHVARLANMID